MIPALLKILRAMALGAFFVVMITVGVAVAIMARPEWIYNSRTVERVGNYLRGEGMDLQWKQVRASVRSEKFWVKEFSLDLEDACWHDRKPDGSSVRICFPLVSLLVKADFTGLKPRLLAIGPISAERGEIRVVSGNQAVEKSPENRPFIPTLPAWARGAEIRVIRVEVARINYRDGKKKYRGRADLTVHGTSARLDGDIRGGKMRAELHARARLQDGMQLRLTGSVEGATAPFRKAWIRDCDLVLAPEGENGSRLTAKCPVVAMLPVPPAKYARFKLPTRAGATIRVDLRAETFPPAAQSRLRGSIGLELQPVRAPLFRGKGTVNATVDGVPAEYPTRFKIDTDLALAVGVPDFRKVVRELESTSWAIPAPLQSLGGTVELAATGKFRQEEGVVPLRFRTDLRSEKQRVKIESQGTLRMSGDPKMPLHAKLDVILDDVRLELPRLEVARPPTFFPDARIARPEPEKPEKPPGLTYEITVKTPEGRPLRLISNLAKEAVPIRVRARAQTGAEPEATLRVQNFSLELFHRDARVDHFNFELAAPSDESTIDGRILFKYADYTIRMLLVGTSGKPRMILESDPPLPQEQLVAVLLFGQPLDSLDPDRMTSVGSAQAALADGALNLASLYVLASTPIQSIGYDPQRGLVSMKVRLGEGTSLNVGASATEVQEIGIRKRLGPHWTITTQLENIVESTDKTVSALLEWALRY